MFEKILIANRGEIALRIHRACKEMGISTVAVHSTADADAMHVRLADESVCLGPALAKNSYLNIPAIVSAATITGADAVHPGYGFLSEEASFASILAEHGFTFIGPSADHITLMGDKVAAKKAVEENGVPVVPGSKGALETAADARKIGDEIGYPVLIKAAGGGGGRGMQIVRSADEVEDAYRMARTEAKASFRNDTVYMEKFLEKPRHIEVQVFADGQGGAVHLGERDCSLQRRHQKVLEEARSPALDDAAREKIGKIASDAVRRIGYRNAGTIEFLYEDGEFYFIEMNTRLQVEHPVTEMITGIDMVREQIHVAAGSPLSFEQSDIAFEGHAIECRITAEHPETFVPSPGQVTDYHPPGGMSVRVDSGLYAGYAIPPHYDSLVAKLIVHGSNRNECLMRLRRSLEEFVIGGIDTTIPLHAKIVENSDFVNGDYDIHWLERFVAAD